MPTIYNHQSHIRSISLLFSDFNYDSMDPGCNCDFKITLFGVFQVGWVSVDVGSDSFQAYAYYDQKHYYWSGSTLSLMFVPIVTSSLVEILNYSINCCQGTTGHWSWKRSFFRVARHFPLFQTVVHATTFFTLKKAKDELAKAHKLYMKFNPNEVDDSNRDHYRNQVEIAAARYDEAGTKYRKALTEFQEMKLYEAFGEAAPQAVLQFAIIMQLGYVSPIQLLTILTSLFSFSLASAEIFLMMKTKNNEVKDATWRQTFILVIPAMFVVVVPRILSLSLITAYAKQYSLLFFGAFVLFNILACLSYCKKDPVQVFLGAVTNVFAPCIVICEGSGFLQRSGVMSSILHIFGQITLFLFVILKVLFPCPDTKIFTPILHCYKSEDINDSFTMKRCQIFLNETACSREITKISYNTSACEGVLPVAWSMEGNFVTICEGFPWWLPLALTSLLLIFWHCIGCIVITKYLNKILDPIKMLMSSTGNCCSYANCFVPAWNENDEETRPIIEDFLYSPSKSTLKGASVKLQELFQPPLVVLSIDHGYAEIMRIIINDINVPVNMGMIERSFLFGNGKMTKMLLKTLKERTIACKSISI